MHVILEYFFSKDFFFFLENSHLYFKISVATRKKILLPPRIALEPVFRWNIKEQRREKNRKE